MELKLAKDEKIIKEYLYSTRAQKGLGGSKNALEKKLIVTTKRVISESKSSLTVIRKEIPLEACDYITSSYSKQATSLIGAIVCFVIGIIGIIASFALGDSVYKYIPLGLGALLIALGVVLLVLFLIKKSASVEIRIAGKLAEHNLLSVGSSNMGSHKKAKKIKIIVDRNTSEIMVNEIGALLLDVKAGDISAYEEKEPAKEESKEETPLEEAKEETKEETTSEERERDEE